MSFAFRSLAGFGQTAAPSSSSSTNLFGQAASSGTSSGPFGTATTSAEQGGGVSFGGQYMGIGRGNDWFEFQLNAIWHPLTDQHEKFGCPDWAVIFDIVAYISEIQQVVDGEVERKTWDALKQKWKYKNGSLFEV